MCCQTKQNYMCFLDKGEKNERDISMNKSVLCKNAHNRSPKVYGKKHLA